MKLVKKQIEYLRKKLNCWEYAYYIKNESIVSDEKYDETLEELRQLELKYPYFISKRSSTQRIGGAIEYGFHSIHHKVPMLSLTSVFDKTEVLLFDKRVKKRLNNYLGDIIYCCELKLDGVAISLTYKQGELVQAVTRGNGKIGEDVTKNARVISSIPSYLKLYNYKQLPTLLEIRGEIFISKLSFLKLNQIMCSLGNRSFSNARNVASGSLRQLDPTVTASRPLMFFCYGISLYIGSGELPNSHSERLGLCNKWGIPIDRYTQLVQGIDKVLEYYNYIKKIRSELEYNIDGIVVKVDNCVYQDQLSYGLKVPNWAIAYKFPSESKFTKLNNVLFKIGRTGIITPVACIDPVTINNVIIRKVSIYNINEIKRLNLMIGDTVLVERSGDVIPKIIKVIFSKRTKDVKSIELPKFCPVCRSKIEMCNYNSVAIRCSSRLTCLAQRKAVLKHFASRKAMNIRGMGEKVIDQLVDKNLIFTPVDIFYLNREKLLSLNRYKEKSAERLLRSIIISKTVTLGSFIYALGIPNVGESVSNHLAMMYKNVENFIYTDFKLLLQSQYIGKTVANNIYFFLRNDDNLKNILDLINPNVGIKWISIN